MEADDINSDQISYDEIIRICALLNIRKAAHSVTRLYDRMLQSADLRITQFSVLVAIARLSPIPLSVLATDLNLDRTTLARNLKRLEDKGWVSSETGKDRRERIVTLTDEGSRLLKQNIPRWAEAQQQVVRELGQQRLETLLAELSILISLENQLAEEQESSDDTHE